MLLPSLLLCHVSFVIADFLGGEGIDLYILNVIIIMYYEIYLTNEQVSPMNIYEKQHAFYLATIL